MPQSFLDSNLYYPDIFESQPIADITVHNQDKKYIDIINGFNLRNYNTDFLLNEASGIAAGDNDDIYILPSGGGSGGMHDNNESLNFTQTTWNDETMLKMLNLDQGSHLNP